MTTTTEAATTKTKSFAVVSSKATTFALVFSLTFPVIYLLCEQYGGPLFTYHPATNRFDWGWAPGRSGQGPAMYWYGWVVSSLIGSTILGALGTLLPQTIVKRIPLLLLIILPTLALIPLAYSLMPFWTKG
jgi:hypothetical protein